MTTADNLANAHEMLTEIVARHHAFDQRTSDQRAGYASNTNSDGGGTSELTGPERIMDIAYGDNGNGRDPDPATTDRATYRATIAKIHTEIRGLHHLSLKYVPTQARMDHADSSVPDRETVGVDGKPLWCRHCLTHGHRSPCDIRRPNMSLCRWCADWQLAQKTLPTAELLDVHHRGGRITDAMIQRSTRTVTPKGKSKKKTKR